MKITKDTQVERIITLELTESEINTITFALGDICYGTLQDMGIDYNKSIISQDDLYDLYCLLDDAFIRNKINLKKALTK